MKRSAMLLKVPIEEEAAAEISRRSRGTPRIANSLLRRVRDFAQVKGNGTITYDIAEFSLRALNIDQYGLDEIDNKFSPPSSTSFMADRWAWERLPLPSARMPEPSRRCTSLTSSWRDSSSELRADAWPLSLPTTIWDAIPMAATSCRETCLSEEFDRRTLTT